MCIRDRGYITYAPEAKEKILGVLPETISDYGVVSEQTAQEMAEGAAKQAHAGCAVATTGVAGPGGGTLKTPVGTVSVSYTHLQSLKLHSFRDLNMSATLMELLVLMWRKI